MIDGIDLRRAPSTGLTITPSNIVRTRFSAWNGIQADSLEITRLERFEYGVTSPFHLLIVSERAERDDGETVAQQPAIAGVVRQIFVAAINQRKNARMAAVGILQQ